MNSIWIYIAITMAIVSIVAAIRSLFFASKAMEHCLQAIAFASPVLRKDKAGSNPSANQSPMQIRRSVPADVYWRQAAIALGALNGIGGIDQPDGRSFLKTRIVIRRFLRWILWRL